MIYGTVAQAAQWPQRKWRLVSRNTFLRQLFLSSYTIPLLVFAAYLLLNVGISGPAYMSDEIGYLDKAATLAGSVVHVSTSWFGGYSLLISPAFFLSSNPYIEWHIVLVLNALMWAGSAALLQYILRRTHPQASRRAIRLAVGGAMLYPAWISMSGYAFSTTGFVLVFMAALAALIKSKLTQTRWLCVAGLLAGYLCWIHPLGFLFLGLFAVLFGLRAIMEKQWRRLLVPLGSLAFGISYLVAVEPWFGHIMRGSAVNDSHYTEGLALTFQALGTGHYWLRAAELLVGLVFSVLVATFGLVWYGALPFVKQWRHPKQAWQKTLNDPAHMAILLSLLSVAAVIGITALSWGASSQLRIDQWVYGRYSDMYLLPLIAFGLLATWRRRQALIIAACVLAAGILINTVATPANTLFGFDNKVNIQSLWPMHLASIVHANHFWLWGVLGAAGIMAVGFMDNPRRKVWLAALLLPVALAAAGNYVYHRTIIRQHTTVSSLYQFVKTHYARSDCIGFTTVPDSNERYSLYSYYLHGYDIEKISLAQWQQQKCTGPYFTYNPSQEVAANLQLMGQEAASGLYIFIPNHSTIALRPGTKASAIHGSLYEHPIIFN